MSYNVPGGVFSSSIGDGATTKDGSFGIAFEKDLGNDWGVNGKARYASYDHVFDFFLDGDGLVNVPETQAQFLNPAPNDAIQANAIRARAACPPRARCDHDRHVHLRGYGRGRAGGRAAVPESLHRSRPAGRRHEHRGEPDEGHDDRFVRARLHARRASTRDAEAKDFNVTTTYLADFHNEARLVNLTSERRHDRLARRPAQRRRSATSTTGTRRNARRSISPIRWRATSSSSTSARASSRSTATSAASAARSFVTDATTPNLSPVQRDVVWGNGRFLTANVEHRRMGGRSSARSTS